MNSKKCPNCNFVNFAGVENCKRCQLSFRTNTEDATGSTDSQLAEWYYSSKNGERRGPVPEGLLIRLLSKGQIDGDTLVWRHGMSQWSVARDTPVFTPSFTVPPPLIGNAVDNNFAWAIAFAPMLSGILITFLFLPLTPSPDKVAGFVVFAFLIRIGINAALCIADEHKLSKAGYDTKNLWIWILLITPGYLIVRASRLKQDYSYVVVWFVMFILSIFIFRI